MEIKITDNEFDSAAQALLVLIEYNITNGINQFISNATFVDVGAGMPEYYSNSFLFRNIGSKVIAIEPIPSFCELFRAKNWEVLEYAVTKDDSKSIMLFTEMRHSDDFKGMAGSGIKDSNNDAINTPDKIFNEYEVNCLSLNTILNKHYPNLERIDILDIDIEGGEIEILKGFNLEKYNPKVMIIENLDPENNGYYDYYQEINYKIMAKCGHNDIIMKQ